jgi:MFS family permease
VTRPSVIRIVTLPSSAARKLPPAFHRLAWSNLAAQSAEQIALAASPIIAVLAFGADEGRAGLLQVAQTLPFVLFAIPIGLIADRMSRSWLMAGSEALRVVSLLAIIASPARADIYKFVDADGKTHFSDVRVHAG